MRHVTLNPRTLVLLAVVGLLVLGGCCGQSVFCFDPCAPCDPCTTKPVVTRSVVRAPMARPLPPPGITPSGFLTDYGRLKKSPEREGSWSWQRPDLDLRVYDHLLIDPVQVILDAEEEAALPEDGKERAAAAFREILVETIDPYYTVVDKASLHVLRVRLALTELVPASEMEDGKPAIGTGGAELEGELIDSLTGDRLLTFVSRIEGSKRGEIAEQEWQAVEGAFREWADRLLDFLDSFKE